ncbi:alpha/beta hydrolase fold domain-containing protein [Segnochrobactraceae bacterium EtOH-i3]
MVDFSLAPQPPLPFPAAEAYSAAALAASRGSWPGVLEHRDLRFGPGDWQRLDIFTPDRPSETPRDVLVFFHGGGWTNGYKEWVGLMAPAVTAAGMILVAPTHRLAPSVRFPVFLEDAVDAVAAARGIVASFGGNPDRLFIAGHSAGGHLAAMIGLKPELCAARGLPPAAIAGCCPVSAILDLHQDDPAPGSLEARVYEMVLADPADDKAASPLGFIRGARAPLFFSWGLRDSERVRRSNEEARAILTAAGADARFRVYDADHFGTHLALSDPGHDWYAVLNAMRRTAPLKEEIDCGLPVPGQPFSWAIRARGTLYTTHGPVLPDGSILEGDITRQAELTLQNMIASVEAAGGTAGDFVQLQIFLVDGADMAPVDAVYRRFFAPPYPNRASLIVAGLVAPGMRIEISAIAELGCAAPA